jgi:hemoglobin-like flavoprotein
MTPDQKTLVQESFRLLTPIADLAARLFHQRLFELDPKLKSLFKGDMEEQGKKLMKMIAAAVNALDRLEEIVPAVQDLGARHAGYGVEEKDYDIVGNALLWTLQQGLDDLYTSEVEEAWIAAYSELSNTMKNAAAEAA